MGKSVKAHRSQWAKNEDVFHLIGKRVLRVLNFCPHLTEIEQRE